MTTETGTALDLAAIEARLADRNADYVDQLAFADVPALIAEVKRLRAYIARLTRPFPWPPNETT